ncbi:synaptonemal complex protein 2 isoform X2 [Pseudochaenichthys georgianus]|uniref:synaptonemal complex protein 2 isoform X2 n=1 Tax=Pseudochaenichthys georgianus TaxID=52239 RepID=UPI001469C564|nr:synaptonemal complex protein 2 isoform X2 [Pseudochaenichthys georgianus]
MAPAQDTQLEKVVDEVLKSGQVQALHLFLQRNIGEGTTIKCSQQFLTKLDKLVSRSLDENDSKSASLGFTILYKCGKNLKRPGGRQGLSGIIAQGLIKKMVQWFEKCRQLWIQCGPKWDETLFNLSEDFFDALLVVHEACKEGTHQITESFLYPVGELAVDPRIYILIQKEAIRKFNLILDKIPVEFKKERKILTSQDASDIMIKLAGQILKGGDYDLQTALMEALCRMATPGQRKELAHRWFSMEHVASAFVKIQDSEFETDCRKFLNLVNGMQGDRRRVYSYPCLEVYLDKNELMMPADEKLEEFWIDFNLDSHSISFYFSLGDEVAQESQWETICINENEVQRYTVKEKGKRKVLHLKLSEVVVVGAVEGSSLTIHFSSSLDILQAARTVYGHSKSAEFVGKSGISVVNTTVKIQMEDSISQVVPESQMSLGESEKNTGPYLPAPAAPLQLVTPTRMRFSESTTFICSGAGGSVHDAKSLSAVLSSNNSAKGKGKPSLEMVRSCDRKGDSYLGELRTTAKTSSNGTTPNSTITATGGMTKQSESSQQRTASKLSMKNNVGLDLHKKNIPLAKAVEMVLAGQGEEQSLDPNCVPDSQPKTGKNLSINWSKLSVSEMLMMPTQKINSLPRSEPRSSLAQQQDRPSSAQRFSVSDKHSQKQLHSELTQRLQQVLGESNQDPAPQEPAAAQRKVSDIKDHAKGRRTADPSASTLCGPKEQQAHKNSLAKGKSKHQMSLQEDAAPVKAPAKASTAKALQKRDPSNVKDKISNALSSKEKRDAEVTGSMVKLISSRYEMTPKSSVKETAATIPKSWIPPLVNRPIFNMSWLSTAKKDEFGTVSLMKSHSKTTTNTTRKDVFAFNTDAPLSAGGKNKTLSSTSFISRSSIQDSSALPSTTKKAEPVAKQKRHVKKHLFSDTDTDYATTDVSWLKESSRKPKPKVTTYSRQAPVKPKAVSLHTPYESPGLPLPSKQPVKSTSKLKKKPDVIKRVEQRKKTPKPPAAAAAAPEAAAAPSRAQAACRRPRRTAAISTKSYRDPDTDDSQSEAEKPLSPEYSSTNHLEKAEKTHKAAQVTKKRTASKQPTKSHRKPESSESESELMALQPLTSKKHIEGQQGKVEKSRLEFPEVKKRKNTSSEQSTDTHQRPDSNKQSDLKKPSGSKELRPKNVLPETSKFNKKNYAHAKDQMNGVKDSWAARHSSFCPSPPLIERMRSAERSAPTFGLTCSPLLTPLGSPLPASPDPPCEDTPSPILLLPKPRSTLSSKGTFRLSSFCSVDKKHRSSKTHSVQSVRSLSSLTRKGQTTKGQTPAAGFPTGPRAAEISSIQQSLHSAPPSPLSPSARPLLTSTFLEQEKPPMTSPPQSPIPEVTVSSRYGFSKMSSVSWVSSQSSTKSSVLTSRVKESPDDSLAVSHKREKTPSSDRERNSEQLRISGPGRKRHISSSSDSEEDEKEEKKKSKIRGQRSPRMKPRKLFKSFAGMSADAEVTHVMSSSHTMSSSHCWEAEGGDGDMEGEEEEEDCDLPKLAVNQSSMFQQFSNDLKNKFKNRHNMVEMYNKQTLKTVQQHVSSLNTQVTKHRTQRLEQVQKVLLDEINKLEKNDTVLKSMEKDLTVYWKKQAVAFHSYQERETTSNETLKTALQSNVCHSLEYEETIFTSQMCLIRKDMKSVQDRLLSEMQDGEIKSVKRGLHALFFP